MGVVLVEEVRDHTKVRSGALVVHVESDPTTEPQKQVEMDCRERKERWRKEGEKRFSEDASA